MTSSDKQLPEGLYESLVTRALAAHLEQFHASGLTVDEVAVDDVDAPDVLARHVRDITLRALRGQADAARRLELVNNLIAIAGGPDDALTSVHQLRSVLRTAAPGQPAARPPLRPSTPLSDAALLTNSPGEPSVGHEISAELSSADRVDVIMAFVKWHGLRLLEAPLLALRQRGVRIRVITTTYMGATERAAVDRLVRDFGADVRVQYDAQRTRLHAKAWLFVRDSGFDTAYVGSSNLSRAAMLDGVEWNVRLSSVSTPALLRKFLATFESYWSDPSFEVYDPDTDYERLDIALGESSGARSHNRATLTLSGLEVRPYPYQQDMLDKLEVERVVHDRHRNLMVAATGTGKTVVAALDYKRLCWDLGGQPTLLFVAHRKEILQQALRTYREVLADPSFGELYVDGQRPDRWQHLFASVQSLSSYGIENIPQHAYSVVVIDEFHHAEAKSYRRILDFLAPVELLGMTATPERGDGVDVRAFFGGRTAVELRLWDALKADLLTPFHYFAVADGLDLRGVEWRSGGYDVGSLSSLVTGNDVRARIILKAVRDKVADLSAMKALAFCVSRDHAHYMNRIFNDAGVPSAVVLGDTPSTERYDAVQRLRCGDLKVVFAVDVFNEGVDVPSVNTVLLLRPTESATVFLQQLGRGLRLADQKPVLTVLDFVGFHRREFRFDLRFRALTGSTRAGLQRDIESGFPFLPAGTQIVLDRQSQDIVLANVKAQLTGRWDRLVSELRDHPTQELAQFLDESGAALPDLVASGRSWARLRREAGLTTRPGGGLESQVLARVRALAHVDDPERARAYLQWLSDDAPRYGDADQLLQSYGRMLFFSLWPGGAAFATYQGGLEALRGERAARDDLRAVIELGLSRASRVTQRLRGDLGRLPLRIHASYTREEVLSAIGYASIGESGASPRRTPKGFVTGVVYSPETNTDAFFVTLRKSEHHYSPTTMYRDYAISRDLFHWESQSTTSEASPTGQRYVNHVSRGGHILLFSREERESELGAGAPYLFLGDATYVEHRGERPMAITWRLNTPMPAADFSAASVVV